MKRIQFPQRGSVTDLVRRYDGPVDPMGATMARYCDARQRCLSRVLAAVTLKPSI